MNNEVVDPRLTTKVVTSYVRHHIIGAGQLSELITSVHGSLAQLVQRVQPEKFGLPRYRYGNLCVTSLSFASIVVIEGKRCDGTSAVSTD
jgi:hypothetical protein